MKPVDEEFFVAVMNAAATRTYRMAARFGLTATDREDMKQELILDMLERADQFDSTKGSAGTFTGVVSEHRATELLDRMIKDRMRLSFGAGAQAANDPQIDEFAHRDDDNVVPMWAQDHDFFSDSVALMDLQKALAYMNDEQVALFKLLQAHQDVPSACKACGVSSATFYRRISELQMHLRMFGFRSAA